jgi:hypothetical protein
MSAVIFGQHRAAERDQHVERGGGVLVPYQGASSWRVPTSPAAIAGLPHPPRGACSLRGDFDSPPGRVAAEQLGRGGGKVGGDQVGATRTRGLADQHDLHGSGAVDVVPQAGDRGQLDGGRPAVAPRLACPGGTRTNFAIPSPINGSRTAEEKRP